MLTFQNFPQNQLKSFKESKCHVGGGRNIAEQEQEQHGKAVCQVLPRHLEIQF